MKSNRASRAVLTTVAVGFLAACSLNPKEDPTRYYVLSNMADDASLLEATPMPDGSMSSPGPEPSRPQEPT